MTLTAALLLRSWNVLRPLPAGGWLFSRLVGWMVPYSGSIGARVCELRSGYARVELADRRGVRNHLRSIHAIALANVGELTSGLAVLSWLPDDARAILVHLSIAYVKKARGRLVAESGLEVATTIDVEDDREVEVVATIVDSSGEVVARVTALWRVGPQR